MPDGKRVGEGLRLLRARGFKPTQIRKGSRSFEGTLPCKSAPIKVQFQIEDWNFQSYPSISILERPDHLNGLMAHIDVAGGLCYFAAGVVILDRYDPATAIAQCLDQATAVLDKIATDPGYRNGEIQDEFMAHWIVGQEPLPWRVLMGEVAADATAVDYIILKIDGENRALIVSDPEEAEAYAQAFGDSSPIVTACKCWLFRTEERPAVPNELPRTIKDLFNWLKIWDIRLYNQLQRILEHEKSYLKYSFVSFAVQTPIGWLGFGFDLDRTRRKTCARSPKLYKQYLHGKGGNQNILRMTIHEIGSSFVHSRNLSYPDLRHKNITLVGCGAIGSYLAQALVRLGAGTGRGSLLLIDPDYLNPGNLGRHALGYPALFKSKVRSLQSELLTQFPLAKIQVSTQDIALNTNLFATDLVIDATGEETVSEMINERRLKQDSEVPVMHIWIKGNGDCVQSLWADKKGHGCYRCLTTNDAHTHRKERFPVLNEDTARRMVGCNAFTPYAVSSPMHAAALATDTIIDWMKGDPSPRFRTRANENANVRQVKNQNISRLNGCPACGHP